MLAQFVCRGSSQSSQSSQSQCQSQFDATSSTAGWSRRAMQCWPKLSSLSPTDSDWQRVLSCDSALYDALLLQPQTTRKAGRQLTLIDGKTGRTLSPLSSISNVEVANLWLACCKMYFCNRNWVWKEGILVILILPLTWRLEWYEC